jgi:hypothetical protein
MITSAVAAGRGCGGGVTRRRFRQGFGRQWAGAKCAIERAGAESRGEPQHDSPWRDVPGHEQGKKVHGHEHGMQQRETAPRARKPASEIFFMGHWG